MTPKEYIASLPEERQTAMNQLRKTVQEHLPKGFEETVSYGMICYVVPHSVYPKGYHANPKQPLPFLSMASQKGGISLYHMGLYADEELLGWFKSEYNKQTKAKLDIGKSCIRFKKVEQIPFDLIGSLLSRITPEMWIATYEQQLNK
jgi:uncharacterized protein YdhG (YjbR/CyaY superfamily)